MIINEEAKSVVSQSAFITLVTLNPDKTPHPIIAGKGEVLDDMVVFGIYKMEQTQKNLLLNSSAWLVAATMQGRPIGYRLNGTAEAHDGKLYFKAVTIEPLI